MNILFIIGHVLVVISVLILDGYNLDRKYRAVSLLIVIFSHCYRLISFKFLTRSDSAINSIDLSYKNSTAVYKLNIFN